MSVPSHFSWLSRQRKCSLPKKYDGILSKFSAQNALRRRDEAKIKMRHLRSKKEEKIAGSLPLLRECVLHLALASWILHFMTEVIIRHISALRLSHTKYYKLLQHAELMQLTEIQNDKNNFNLFYPFSLSYHL